MDIVSTENYYVTLDNDSLCSCDYCRNFCKEVQGAYPELSDYLAGLGVDIRKPFETMPHTPHEGTSEYVSAQYVVMGNAADFTGEDVHGVHVGIADLHPMTGIGEEHCVIEVSPIKLKWTV